MESMRAALFHQKVRRTRAHAFTLFLSLVASSLCVVQAFAGTGGSISGRVQDSAAHLVPRASILLEEVKTGLSYRTTSLATGAFTLPVLPVGEYRLEVRAPGFSVYERTGILLDAGDALTMDATLAVGSVAETISVADDALHVESLSTQLGEVIRARQIEAVPLDGRSFTDLLSLQAGVAPSPSITAGSVEDIGATVLTPSGSLNPGTVSINGQRETANSFSVNGSDSEEDVNFGTAIIPNLDSIAEFRMLTSNFDAEHGEFSGGQIDVVTRSGTNALHGSVFEFLRNTALDARNPLSPTRGAFEQNQYGGTLGGPIRHDRAFFFADYQGTRQTQGIDTGGISVPSLADRSGDLLDRASGTLFDPVTSQPLSRVSGSYLASLLSQKLGRAITQGEAYYYPGCTDCVLPGAILPAAAYSLPAQHLLGYIPEPNNADGTFSTSASNQTLHDDKGAIRLDSKTRIGQLSAYYFSDSYTLNDPYPVAQGGATVPGFNALDSGRAQLLALADTLTLNSTSINEARFSYLRDNTRLGQPVGGTGVSLASQGFVKANGAPSIVALDPGGESVQSIDFNGFSIGAAYSHLAQVNNTFQFSDTFSKVLGAHTLKLGLETHNDQVNSHVVAQFNGSFVFAGTETGDDFTDFLLGVPSQYNQSQLKPFYGRNHYTALFAQDAWQLRHGLTLNAGLRWDRVIPWTEKNNEISTFVAGRQSVVFPTAPAGILFPGDPGVPRTLAPISNHSFAPRVGLAWSPQVQSEGLLRRIIGAPGDSSIRVSAGQFYTAIDALSIGVLAGNAPYGTTYTSPIPPLFSDPFVSAATGEDNNQPFPYALAPAGVSAKHPDANVDWASYEPISGIPGYATTNKIPYTEQWSLSLERQAGPGTVLSAAYVGNASHHQRVLVETGPGDPALCLSVSQLSQVLPGTPTCGPGGENGVYYPVTGGVIHGTRTSFGPAFGSNAFQSTTGNASYHALELGLHHSTGRLQLSAAYTYAKSLDNSSSTGEEVNPYNPRASHALSAFDLRHNLVVSYDLQLPVDLLLRPSRFTRDWSLSGITHIQSGFPVTMAQNGDNSLIGTNPDGINNQSIDEPDRTATPLCIHSGARPTDRTYFNADAFRINALGTPGNVKRRYFPGPGGTNFDAALAKKLSINESNALLFRIEAFNVFNHTQFSRPNSIDGDIGSSTFGQVINAAAPRILQAAVKYSF